MEVGNFQDSGFFGKSSCNILEVSSLGPSEFWTLGML